MSKPTCLQVRTADGWKGDHQPLCTHQEETVSTTIYNQEKPVLGQEIKNMRVVDACARLVTLLGPTSEFQGAKLSFDFRVVDGKLGVQNIVLEKGPPTKLVLM